MPYQAGAPRGWGGISQRAGRPDLAARQPSYHATTKTTTALPGKAATARRYDGGVSLASYVASGNPAWAAEAQAFVAWRDAVWAYAYAELDKVQAGQREQPGVEAFLADLPQIEWP